MTTKEKLLELFEAGRGEYFSGEDIARRFSPVSYTHLDVYKRQG